MPQAVVPVGESRAAVRPPSAHPLAGSVATADATVKLLSFRIFDRTTDLAGDGWIRCDHALSDPDFFPRWRVQVAQQLAEQQSHALESTQVPEKTTGGYVLQWYVVIPSYLGAVLFHCARRVPSLSPRQLSFRLDPAKVAEVALHPGRFWCLPDDPDAGHPDALPVPDEAALGAILRRQVIAHAAHFLTVYGPMVRFGFRTQWAAVTDVLDSALLLAGRSFGSPQAGAADARLVLADGEKPLTSASTIRELTDDRGRTHWTRLRGSCCFLYALPGVERPCASCPRINDSERACIFGTLDRV
ncbi:MAG: (2Fe-2S)-binding protein [Pseudonocardiaceae bacterium]